MKTNQNGHLKNKGNRNLRQAGCKRPPRCIGRRSAVGLRAATAPVNGICHVSRTPFGLRVFHKMISGGSESVEYIGQIPAGTSTVKDTLRGLLLMVVRMISTGAMRIASLTDRVLVDIRHRTRGPSTPIRARLYPARRRPAKPSAIRVLLRLEGIGPNRPGLLAEAIKFVEDVGGRVLYPWGTVGIRGEGKIELLCEANSATYNAIRGLVHQRLPDLRFRVFRIRCINPTMITLTVRKHAGLAGETAACLARADCDIVQTMCVHSFAGPHKDTMYTFACLVSLSNDVTTDDLQRVLDVVAGRRWGFAVVEAGLGVLAE